MKCKHLCDVSQTVMKNLEADTSKLDSEISNYRSNIEIRTSELVRLKSLKAEESRLSATTQSQEKAPQDRQSGGTLPPTLVNSQPPRLTATESIFTQNYGASTITQDKPKKTGTAGDLSMTQSSKGRGSTTGQKVKNTKSYCTLI